MRDDIRAALDFGSNTVTLAVYRIEQQDMQLLLKEKVRLGILRYIHDGVLSAEGMARAAETIAELHHAASKLTDCVYCFATASLRGVSNAQEAVRYIKRNTGVDVELISGEQEAYYDYVGLKHCLPHIREAVALDIGGGSTEIIHIRAGSLEHSATLPTGSLKLILDFSDGRSPTAEERGRITTHLCSMIKQVAWLPEAACDLICTIGGTARAAARVHRAVFNRQEGAIPYSYPIADLDKALLWLTDEIRLPELEKLIPGRTQTIVPGILAIQAVSAAAGAHTAVVSQYGVREGYLLDKKLSGKTP